VTTKKGHKLFEEKSDPPPEKFLAMPVWMESSIKWLSCTL